MLLCGKGAWKTEAIREYTGRAGYASRFDSMINYIMGLLPAKEIIDGTFRRTTTVYPEIVLRELIANALIHQLCIA